uniref:Uncharacterized protein n=1 Tax=Arundo donax TaxID=35708 RepID=A0A0A9UAU8_ARUDO
MKGLQGLGPVTISESRLLMQQEGRHGGAFTSCNGRRFSSSSLLAGGWAGLGGAASTQLA